MKWKWAAAPVAALAVIILGMGLIGAMIPRHVVAQTSAVYRAKPEQIWEALVDVESYSTWRTDLTSAERLPDREGRLTWREVSRFGRFVVQAQEINSPHHFVARIVESNAPFDGAWVFSLTPENSGTRLEITENAEIENPFVRFTEKFLVGRVSVLTTYLKDLGRKMGEVI